MTGVAQLSRDGSSRRRWLQVAALSAALAAAAAGVASTEDDASAASGAVAFREVAQASRGFDVPGESMLARGRVARSASQAATVLRAWGLDSAAAKSVDFARESVIVVLAPYQSSGGYRARVTRVVVRGRQAVLTGSVRYEGSQLATQSIERPWVVIALKRASLKRVRANVRLVLR
jgi:hypothetical protein